MDDELHVHLHLSNRSFAMLNDELIDISEKDLIDRFEEQFQDLIEPFCVAIQMTADKVFTRRDTTVSMLAKTVKSIIDCQLAGDKIGIVFDKPYENEDILLLYVGKNIIDGRNNSEVGRA